MANNVRLSSLAKKDLEKSSEWYEKQQPGLGEIFAEASYDAVISISRNPAPYPIKKADTREFSVHNIRLSLFINTLRKMIC